MNYYVVLGIPTDADDLIIRRAFRSLVRRYHPDVTEESSSEKFRLLVEAYETLSDPIRRRAYDRSLRPTPLPRLIPVEPMTAPIDPLVVPQRPVPTYAMRGPVWMRGHFDRLFEELWQSMEDEFLSPRFRRRW